MTSTARHVAYLERPDVFFGKLRELFAAKAV
jgi:hypothetical protein